MLFQIHHSYAIWALRRLKPPATLLCVQQLERGNIKVTNYSHFVTRTTILQRLFPVHCFITGFTHWGGGKMVDILHMTYSNAFSWMRMYEFRVKLHWNVFLMVQLTVFQHRFRQWLGADQATSHSLNHWWFDYRLCITRSQRVNGYLEKLQVMKISF